MLRHRLPGEPGAVGQPGNRLRLAEAQPGQHRQPRLVAQRGKHQRAVLQLGQTATACVRHAPQCSSICSVQPPSFMRNASSRRRAGSLSKPDSTTRKQRAAGDRLQRELDQRRRLLAVVLVRIDRVGMPGEREQPLRLHPLHHRLPSQVLVARIRDLPVRRLPGHERSVELHAKPGAELLVVGQRPPDARHGRLELDGLLDAIAHAQPPGCSITYHIAHNTQPNSCVK